MPWLRLDDTFLDHPKVVGLSDKQLRQHLAAMLYAARHKTGGLLPEPALKALRITRQNIATFIEIGLWDEDENGDVFVHDFDVYNPVDTTQADRARRYRARKKQGPSRDASRVTDRDASRDGPRARAGTRAEPDPTPPPLRTAAAEVHARTNGRPSEPAAAQLELDLREIGVGPEWISAALSDIDRANAWLERTHDKAQTNPAGYFRRGFETGAWPTSTTPRISPVARRQAYVRTVGWRLDDDHLEHELRDRYDADDADVHELLDLAADLRGTT